MQMNEFQRTLAARILSYLVENSVEKGSHLPEAALCSEFNVSRTPVRAALNALEQQGVIERRPNRGYFTAQDPDHFKVNDLPEPLDEKLYFQIAEDRLSAELPQNVSEADLFRRYNVPKPVLQRVLQRLLQEGLVERRPGRGWMFCPVLDSPRAHDESYRFRMVVEPALVLEPGFKLDEERAAACEEKHLAITERRIREISSIQLYEMNAEFHELLAASSGNRFFLDAVRHQNRLRRFVGYHWVYGAERAIETCTEHLEILHTLRRGDRAWASALLRRHLDISGQLSPYEKSAPADREISPQRIIQLF